MTDVIEFQELRVYLTAGQVGQRLGMHRLAVLRRAQSGELPSVRAYLPAQPEPVTLFRKSDIDAIGGPGT